MSINTYNFLHFISFESCDTKIIYQQINNNLTIRVRSIVLLYFQFIWIIFCCWVFWQCMHIFCLWLFLLSVMFLSYLSISIFSRLQSLQPYLVLNFDLVLFKVFYFISKFISLSSKFQIQFDSSVVCLFLLLLNEDLWLLCLCLKLFPVDPKYCLVVLSVVIVALYIMLEIKHWLFQK